MDVTGFEKLLKDRLAATEQVQAKVEQASQKIQNKFNPLNMENVRHVDGDTFALKDQPDVSFRVQNDPSYGVDTYESDPAVYAKYPDRLAAHKRNYAKLTGRPEWSITTNELVDRGKVQSAQTRARMDELGKNNRLGYKVNGVDDYGRQLIQLFDTETGENFYSNHSGMEQNAAYDSKFNAGQQLDDIFSGERGRQTAFRGGRGAKNTLKDLGTSLAVGTGRMASGLAQGTITMLGGEGPAVDRFFSAVNNGLEEFSDYALSNEALARNARIDRNRERNVEAFGVRKAEYLKKGYSDTEAGLMAGMEEFQDTVADLLTEPGYVIDKTVESLPYMIGVGAAGRVAVNAATKSMSKRVANQVSRAGGNKKQALESVDRYLKSEAGKKELSRVATGSGVTTVGVTEALTTSTDVYNSIANMSEEEALQSEQYRSLRDEGMTHTQATRSLAKAAFETTFVPGMLIAGAASFITGAAGWESRLFTRKAGESVIGRGIAAKGTAEAVEGGIAKKAAVGTVRNVGRFARFAGPAGASEATEEAIQSGSQEFLTQLANFNAGLGPAPGPGIGAAAGEGAAIGFVSGAGAQTVIGGAKKLADSDLRSSGLDKLDSIKNVRTLTDKSGTPGGSKAKAQSNLKNVTPEKAATDLDKFAEVWEKTDTKNLDELVAQKANIDILMEVAEQSEEGVTPRVQEMYDRLHGSYVESVDKAAQNILKRNKPANTRTAKEKKILQEAARVDAPSVRGNETTGRVYEHTRAAVNRIEEQTKESIEVSAEVALDEIDSTLKSSRVAFEKMGRVETDLGPGLMGHFERISEAIANNDPVPIKKRFEKLDNFINSQKQKIVRLENFINSPPEKQLKHKQFTYKPKVTERYHDMLQNELDTMMKVREDLVSLYKEWNSDKNQKADIPAAPAVKPRRNYGPKSTATTTEGKEDEKPTKQRSAPDNVRQPSSDRKSGTTTEAEQATDTSSKSESERAEGTSKTAKTKSKSGESSDTESTAANVVSAKDAARVEAINKILNVAARVKTEAERAGVGITEIRRRLEAERSALLAGKTVEETPSKPTKEAKVEVTQEAEKEKQQPKSKKAQRIENLQVANVDPNAPFKLNEGQQSAYDKAIEFLRNKSQQTMAIIGSAGTGKTTLVNEILKKIRSENLVSGQIILTTPTHRANSVIRTKNPNMEVMTLHSLLGLQAFIDLEKFDARNIKFEKKGEGQMPFGGLLIVDESSMINDALFKFLLQTAEAENTRIIFLGDQAQLGPVNQATDSKALTSTDELAKLTQVMRAKNVELLAESMEVREDGNFSYETAMDAENNGVEFTNDNKGIVDRVIDLFQSDEFKENPLLIRMLAYRNDTVARYNRIIRTRLFGEDAPSYVKGDLIMGYASFGKDQIANGLDYIVEKVSEKSKGSIWGVPIDVFNLTIQNINTGGSTTITVMDPFSDPEKIAEVAAAGRNLIDLKQWKKFYEGKNKIAMPFDVVHQSGRQKTNVLVKTLDYGYSHTIHKSQGGTYTYIGINANDIGYARTAEEQARLRYVAVTRAERGAFILTAEPLTVRNVNDATATPTPEPARQGRPAQEPTPEAEVTAPETLSAALDSTVDALTILQRVIDNPVNKGMDAIARRLMAAIFTKPTVKMVNAETFNTPEGERPPRGRYHPSVNLIFINKDLVRTDSEIELTFMHEMAHAALQNWYERSKTSTDPQTQELFDLYEQVKDKALEQLDAGINGSPHPTYDRLAAVIRKRPEELITHAIGTDWFQRLLKQTPSESGNLWSDFLDFFAKVLGIKRGTQYADVLSLMDQILTLNVAETEGGARAEAQPERSAEPEVEATTPTYEPTNDELWDQLAEVNRLQKSGATDILFPSDMQNLQQRMEYLLRNGHEIASALAQLETEIQERLDRSIPRTKLDREALNLDQALQAATELVSKGTTSVVGNTTEGAADFTQPSQWERVKKWLGQFGSPEQEGFADIVIDAFRGILMPPNIAAGFETARDKAGSLITAIPNLHEILNNTAARRQLYDALKLTPEEEAAFDAFADFRNEMEDAIVSAYQELGKDKIQYQDGNRIVQNPAYLLTDTNDELVPAAVTAIAYESMNWLTGDGSSLFNNDETIARILGLPDGTTPNAEQERLRTAGTLRRNVVDNLGAAIWRHMNLRVKKSPDIAPNLEERMEAALGTVAVRALQITRPARQKFPGRVDSIVFKGPEFQKMKGEETVEHENYKIPITFIRAKASSTGRQSQSRFSLSQANAALQEATRPGRTALNRVFGVSNVIKEPMTDAPTEENIPTRALRSVTKLSKKMRTAIKFQQSRKWKANTRMIDKLRQFTPEQYLKLAHEYEADLDAVHDMLLDNVEGRNRTLLTALENALEWGERQGDRELYFTYSMTRTGRVMINSTYINPQQSKLHRFLFGQTEWQETIQPGDSDLLENFKIAVAQGMGLKVDGKGVDKLTREVILAAVEERMNQDDVRLALEELATEGPINLEETLPNGVLVPTALGNLLSAEGTHTLAALMAWQDYLNANGGAFTTTLPIEVDGVTNGFAAGLLQTPPTDPEALERLKDLLRAVGVIFTEDEEKSFSEWLQNPNNKDNYQTAAQKTAEAISRMMPGGDIFNQIDPNEDRGTFYRIIGEEMQKLLASGFGPTEQDLRDPKVGRDFAKNPLMIVAYGASSRTVAANLVNKIYIKAHEDMAAVNRMRPLVNETAEQFQTRKANALLDVLNRYMDVSNVGKEAFYKDPTMHRGRVWKYKPDALFDREDLDIMIKRGLVKDLNGEPVTSIDGLARSFVFKDSKKEGYLKTNFTRAMEAVYGRGIEVALEEMLEGIRDIRDTYTQAITMMNAIFAIEFQRRVDLEATTTDRVVGRKRRREIVERMHAEGLVPSIASAYSDPNNLSENLELTAWQHNLIEDQNVKIIHDDYEGVTRIVYGDGKREVLGDTRSTTNSLTSRDPSTDVGVAGVVGTIHSLDGTNSADIFGRFDVLNMFDAWVMKLSDLGVVPTQGNNRFYNQHHDYDMGQELVRSLDRMMLLVTQGDTRLTPAQRRAAGNLLVQQLKAVDRWTEDDHENYLIDTKEDGTSIYDTERLMQDMASRTRAVTERVTAAKAEIMQIIGRMDQFANDGTAYVVPENRRDESLPTLEETEKHARQVAVAEKISTKAKTLARNLERGDFNKAFFNWLQEEQVRPSEALRVLMEVLGDRMPEPMAQSLSQMLAVVHQYTNNTKTIVVGKLPEDMLGRYFNNRITLDDTQFTEEDSPVETLLHEIIHAATDEALVDLWENNRDLFDSIYKRGKALYDQLAAKEPNKLNRPQAQFVAAFRANTDQILQTSEYFAYVQTALTTNDVNQMYLAFGVQGEFLNALQGMGQVFTQGNAKGLKYRSSKDKVNNKLFDKAESTKLESQKLWDNYEEMEALDANTDVGAAKGYRDFIKHVMEGVLIPGLANLTNDLMLKIGVQPDGTKNVGEVQRGSDADIMKVQAAGGKLSNNNEMSNQEVFAHELFHAVTGFTIEVDTKIRTELRKIYEFAKTRLTWEHFMPPEEDWAGPRDAIEAAAKERYDYIFGDVEFDTEGNPKYDQLQEFAAIGLSNKAMAVALSRIDAPTANEPLWDGSVLSFLINLIQRGLEILRGYSLGTRRAQNSADALFKLSQKIVTINRQAEVRKYQKRHDGMWRNSVDARANEWIKNKLDSAQQRLRLSEEEKKSNGSVSKWIRMGTHGAIAMRTADQQKANNEFLRHLGVNKSNALSEIISEVLPYNKDDRGGADGKMGFLDLLRHSKVLIDIARQRAIEHSRSVLLASFDKKQRRTRAQRLAMTNVVMRTDLHALLMHNDARTLTEIQEMLRNEQLVDAEIDRLSKELTQELQKQGATKVRTMYERQMQSLANYMTRGVMTEDNGMKNVHNIVRQFNLADGNARVPLKNAKAIDPIVDQLTTLYALKLTDVRDRDLALQVIDHEMSRTDDNGFMYLMGMYGNFKSSALRDLFDNNPVQMRKGYVYDVTDGDRNIEVIFDTPDERKRMEDLGMTRIGLVTSDPHDRSAPYPRAMYKGYRGANTWQKSVVSLTSTQRQGTNLFEVSGYNPLRIRWSLKQMIAAKDVVARSQYNPKPAPKGREKSRVYAIPVLNERGEITDYTYEMSLADRQQHLKNSKYNDYFDQVIPRMFGSIPDRVNSKKINSQSADLIYREYEAFKDSPEHNFVEIGKYSKKARGKDMWNVIPADMKRELAVKFAGTRFVDKSGRLIGLPLRDEAVNLVLGFRKLSILDIPSGRGDGSRLIKGQKKTFAVKTAEKIWQEIMQLVRIKMAIINPTVVVGNLSSNFGILLARGIPEKYIAAKTSEAIRSMRQYQRDVRRVDELQREIGVRIHGKHANLLTDPAVRRMINERERLRAELRLNPVGHLVEEGLFTSIVEQADSDEDTYREWIVGGALDKLKGALPSRAVQLTKEAYMIPGSNSFNMAIAATQYGDFIGRYVQFKYDTEVGRRVSQPTAAQQTKIAQYQVTLEKLRTNRAQALEMPEPNEAYLRALNNDIRSETAKLKSLLSQVKTGVEKKDERTAINDALASFIYYDMPQNRWLQYLNDNGFMMFTKFFLRIQPVIAQMFQENPVKATGVLLMQQALMSPMDENIGKYALLNGLDNRFEPFPLIHPGKLDPLHPSLFQWFGFLGL